MHNRFPNLGIYLMDWETPREFDFGGQWDLITELLHYWGNRFLESTNKTLCAPGSRRKEQWPHKRLSQTSLWVSRSLQQRHGSKVACRSPLEGNYCYHPYHSLASGRTTGREHSHNPTETGLKIYWAWPCPTEQDPHFTTASPSHQGASTSLLFISIRGKTEWKPQPQKTN